MTTKRKITVFVSALILIALAIFFLSSFSLQFKTAGAVINLLIPAGKWRPLEIFTRKPIKEVYTIKSISGRTLTIHIYKPQKEEVDSAMIIYTPFIGGGLDDSRLVNLADTFSRIGFIVAIPLQDENQLIVNREDVDDVISTALFLKNNSDLEINQLGFFGISYGNGPVIIASVDPRIKELVSFIISFSGYYNFQNALHFVRTGEYSYQDIQEKIEPHSYVKEILSKTIKYYNMSEEEFFKSTVLEDLKTKLSPSKVIEEIDDDFFIIHSIDDTYIPYTESMRLYDALRLRSGQAFRDRPITMFALTTVFEHGVYKRPTLQNIRQHYFPSFADFYNFIYILLQKYG